MHSFCESGCGGTWGVSEGIHSALYVGLNISLLLQDID